MQRDWLKDLFAGQSASRPEDLSDDQSADKRASRPVGKSVIRQADMKAGRQARRLTAMQTGSSGIRPADWSAYHRTDTMVGKPCGITVDHPVTRQTDCITLKEKTK
ncbi:hypothetical protein RS666_17410 [Phocaeicola dorei]|uniref:hypothetical protein n=1 Tax=Phocaeicola dorei TaxID=357276 RepID=UPI00295530F3|nr:hypothetical protein [Phocaeicola dorei]MDV7063550.1 hypothetical protein [Phocaeicola dorei]